MSNQNGGQKPCAFVTGISSGLGLGLAEVLIEQGYTVYGLARRSPPLVQNPNLQFIHLDLNEFEKINQKLEGFIKPVSRFDLVILNAGVLGEIQDLQDCSLKSLKEIMDINVWANKVLLDSLLSFIPQIDQVITISSGAAVNGNRGWGGYALSKAALNMLTALYAAERSETHFTALAPGLVDTAMQDYIYQIEEVDKFASLQRIQKAKGTEQMPTPYQAAQMIVEQLAKLKMYKSGDFVDIRSL